MDNRLLIFIISFQIRRMIIKKANIDSKEDEQELKLFIQMAYQARISWKALAIIIDHKTPTLDKSKQAIEILLENLQTIYTKFDELVNNDSTEISSEANSEIENHIKYENFKEESVDFEANDEVTNEEENDEEEEFNMDCLFCDESFTDNLDLKQ